MKIAFNLVVSTLSLAALLGGTASHATDVADLPLKASVLAKPNVIFGVDDSGSTDGELLLATSSGQLWWNGTTAWDTARGKPLATSANDPLNYLFPMGLADANRGGSIYPTSSANSRPAPPTVQFAWVRSARYNPQYYNPAITYAPWSPGYVDGAKRSYANATTTAAPGHPAIATSHTLNLTAQWDASNTNWSNPGFRFYVQRGMVVPAGSRVVASSTTSGICSGSTERVLTTDVTSTNATACWASIPYFPATYWHAADCGTTSTAENATCVLAPDGTTKLKRYEIKPSVTSYPGGRTYAQEIQNFANWFTYYRKRKLSLAAAMGQVLENITGLRMGMLLFNSASTSTTPSAITMYDADVASDANNRFRIIGEHYKLRTAYNSSAPTPTHATMSHIGRQYHNNTSIIQYACQRNAMFIATDGFADASPSGLSVPAYNANTYGSGAPYQTTISRSLADIALAYFTARARTGLPEGRVPLPPNTGRNPDTNKDLHVNTYGLSLGARGTLWPSAVDPFTTAPIWPTPSATDPTMLDDLWHATINGRGQMYMADTPEETTAGIRAGLTDILSQTGAQGGVAVSTINLQRGDGFAYYGTYNPAGWTGDLTANTINTTTGAVAPGETWSASAELLARPWAGRVIASFNGTAGVSFNEASVGAVVNNDGDGGNYGVTAEVMNYLRGDRTHEGTKFRTRASLIGAVINSEPAVDRDTKVAYVASGEGMLHAVDIDPEGHPGKELWAYVPGAVLPQIGQTTERTYSFKTKLDGSPVIAKVGANDKLLIAGMGAAGRSYYAIDVTSPRDLSEPQLAAKVKWEFPAAGDSATRAKMGQTLGKPLVVALSGGGHGVLLTSGYNVADGKGRLWIVNPTTGAIIHEFTTPDGSGSAESGLAHVSPFVEGDGSVRYVYGGDLLGNVWRFDLADRPAAPHKVAVLKDDLGKLQPVTAAPELMKYADKRFVLVGTGRLLGLDDFGKSDVQSFYVIADGGTLSNARSALTRRTLNPAATGDTPPVTGTEPNLKTGRGWYMDLPSGEQQNTRPVLARGAVSFVTNKAGKEDCSASSYLYVLDVLEGDIYAGSDFVRDEISDTVNSSGLNALLTDGGLPRPCTGANCPPPPPVPPGECQRLVATGQTTDGETWAKNIGSCPSIEAAKNAWREVRRRAAGP